MDSQVYTGALKENTPVATAEEELIREHAGYGAQGVHS